MKELEKIQEVLENKSSQGAYIISHVNGHKYAFMDKRTFLKELERKLDTNLYEIRGHLEGNDYLKVFLDNSDLGVIHEKGDDENA